MLTHLEINQFRNLSQLTLEPCQKFNLITGPNGSGKTSILEAIHMLGLGRSFRSRSSKSVIQEGKNALTVFGILGLDSETRVGIEKQRNNQNRIRIDQQDVASAASLAELFPLQVIHPDSYRLLDSGPRYRRQFLDWGLFHVEQHFFSQWQQLKHLLLQRNAALKTNLSKVEIQLWDEKFIEVSTSIESMRHTYFEAYYPIFRSILTQVTPLSGITLHYKQGWNPDKSLAEILEKSFSRDFEKGHTQYGPHRSDLEVLVRGIPVQDILSRGQQKSLVYALRLAQGILFHQTAQKKCVFLIDDLCSELDQYFMEKVLDCLIQVDSQIFMTAVHPNSLEKALEGQESKLFHVEHMETDQKT